MIRMLKLLEISYLDPLSGSYPVIMVCDCYLQVMDYQFIAYVDQQCSQVKKIELFMEPDQEDRASCICKLRSVTRSSETVIS
jgi:hypothetical protein